MVIPVPKHQVHTFALRGSRVWDRVGLKIEDRQEGLGIHSLVCFRSICKA